MLIKAFWIALAMLACLLLAFNCNAQVKNVAYRTLLKKLLQHSVPEITVAKAKQDSTQALWLDAREEKEFQVSHHPNGRYIGYDHFELSSLNDLPKDTAIIVYCSVGYRSEKIAEKLIKAGFTNVKNLYGGIFEWVNEDQPVVDAQGPTQRVHAFDRSWGVWLRKGKKVY